MRGEDMAGHYPNDSVLETPPHAWGRPVRSDDTRGNHRNTPTCVGKTEQYFAVSAKYRKHPHMRGEDLIHRKSILRRIETPPHAWGRLIQPFGGGGVLGNTPTCVGKTLGIY